MHLHNIEGLSEEYIYFNDDLFPVADSRPEDFYRDGKAVLGFSRHLFAGGMFKQICRNSDRMARGLLSIPGSLIVVSRCSSRYAPRYMAN